MSENLEALCKLPPQELADAICRVQLKKPAVKGFSLHEKSAQEMMGELAQKSYLAAALHNGSFLDLLSDMAYSPFNSVGGTDALGYVAEHMRHLERMEKNKEPLDTDTMVPSAYLQQQNFGSATFVEEAREFFAALAKQAAGQPLAKTDKLALANFNAVLDGFIFREDKTIAIKKNASNMGGIAPYAKADKQIPMPPMPEDSLDIEAALARHNEMTDEQKTVWRIQKYQKDLGGVSFDDAREFLMGHSSQVLYNAQNTRIHLERDVRPMCAALCRQLGIQPKDADRQR